MYDLKKKKEKKKEKEKKRPTYRPSFFSTRYRKQTYIFFLALGHLLHLRYTSVSFSSKLNFRIFGN